MLTDDEVERFVREGVVAVRGAFAPDVARRCRDKIWAALDEDPTDPATWTRPVARLGGFATAPFREAASTPVLHEAFDQLVGPGRWRPLPGLGTIPVRFPVDADPGDDGWHVEASTVGSAGEPRVEQRTPTRALLLLFLFDDVEPDGAPTRIRVGSHVDVPRFLEGTGDEGRDWMALCADVVAASADRAQIVASGSAGDVFLCHPFVVHAASRHRGRHPRLMAQPPLPPVAPLDLDDPAPPPVVRAIHRGQRAGAAQPGP